MRIVAERKKRIIADNRRDPNDSGSPEVQVSLLTARINDLTEHLGGHKKDNHSRRGLVQMVAKRNRLLKYLAREEPDRYKGLIGRLGLRK